VAPVLVVAIARRLASSYHVAICGRRPEPLDRVTAETGGLSIVGDTSREEDVERIVAATISRFGRLDALILNAGLAISARAAGDVRGRMENDNSTSTSQVRSW